MTIREISDYLNTNENPTFVFNVKGHEVYDKNGDGWFYYKNNDELCDFRNPRPCIRCNLPSINNQDACIASLPNVINACCGHGKNGYFMVSNTRKVYLFDEKTTKIDILNFLKNISN